MKILLFGATGRVGNSIVAKSLGKGHQVVAFVRDESKLTKQNEKFSTVQGDIYDNDTLKKLQGIDFDIVVNVIGADPLKPSSIFSDTTGIILKLLAGRINKRYIAITGTAQMDKTFFGRITIGIMKLTPVKNGIFDHQNAYDLVSKSNINWVLIGCPYIKDGVEKGFFKRHFKFGGGFKTIHPGDVATAIVEEFDKPDNKKIIGIWY